MTYEVAREPHPKPRGPGDFLWRLSIADVEAPGPFSSFEGHERLIAVVSGQGMTLLRGLPPAGEEQTELEPWRVFRFDGAERVRGELPFGAVRDFNVIFDPALIDARLSWRTGRELFVLSASDAIVLNVAALPVPWECEGPHGELRRFDALRVRDDTARFHLGVEARVAVVTLDRKPR